MTIYDLNVPRTMPAFQKIMVDPRPKPVIMLFYMDMCPHCIMMKPAWRQAKLAMDPKSVNIAEIEYSNMERLPKEMQDVRGFPSIKVYRGTRAVDEYLGERTPEGFLNFMRKYASAKPTRAPSPRPKSRATREKTGSKK